MKNLIKIVLMFVLTFAVATTVMTQTQVHADASVSSNQKAVYKVAKVNYGWGKVQAQYLNKIISRESGWNVNARNGRYVGLFQTTNVRSRTATGQAKQGLRYIQARYGTPHRAWNHVLRTGWY